VDLVSRERAQLPNRLRAATIGVRIRRGPRVYEVAGNASDRGCLWERSLGETAEPSHLAAPTWAHLGPGQAPGKARVRSPRAK
jgi:hypothetical protein